MRIVIDHPPIFDEIDAAFHVRGQPVIFAWGDTIFNPQNIDVPPCLLAHEAVHGEQQGGDIAGWWRKYIDDQHFRLTQEVPAHQAEFRAIWKHGNRHERRSAIKITAQRLASPLYGRMLTLDRARRVLRGLEEI